MDFAPMSITPMSLAPMSPLGMFIYAGPVSKLVMALLLAAAVWTWVLIIDGVFVLRRLSQALDRVRAGGDIGVLWPIAEAAQEASQAELPNESIHQKRERILQQMNRAAREFMLDAEGGLPVLAIVASAGPFVGLFGTVWGIMSSFSGIAQTQDTSSCGRRARHRGCARRDGLWARRRHSGRDRL